MGVELKFNTLEDFEPDQLVQQVEPLRKMVEARRRFLTCYRKWMAMNKLEELLQDIIQNSNSQQQLSTASGLESDVEGGVQ